MRRTSFADPWGEGAQFLVAAAACTFLFATGLLGALTEARARPWHSVYMVFGILLLPLTLYLLVVWVGDPLDTAEPLNAVWIFLLTAVAGVIAGLVGRARYGFLLAGLALIGAWLGLWEELLSTGLAADYGTFRGLLMVIALILLASAAGVYLLDRGRDPDAARLRRFRYERGFGYERASELVTAAAVAAVAGAGFLSLVEVSGPTAFGVPVAPDPGGYGQASLFWDAVLLVVSLLSIAAGARLGHRGLGYVGAIGLLTFLGVVGADLDDDSPAGSVLGWPLVLLVVGAAAFVASLIPSLRIGSLGLDRLDRGDRDRSGAPPPGGTPPPPAPPPPAAPSPPPAGPQPPP